MPNQGKQQGQSNRGGGTHHGSRPFNQGGDDKGKNKKSEDDFRSDYKQVWGNQFGEILKPEKTDYNTYINTLKKYVSGKFRNGNTDLSASQLRNIFFDVRKVKEVKELYPLRPKLAYAAGRADKDAVKEVMQLFDDLMANVKTQDELKSFQDFFEAIIAYHKFYGGKN
ncbi:MAG: type III-A CRISPR-associated protein Csm2 [Chloroherpetonaceae bacterium]